MNPKETWLWTALITPFTEDGGAVDMDAMVKLIKRQEAAGNGVMVLGSTGESLALTDDEKREIVRVTCGLKLKVPVMVGTPNANLKQTMAWIEFCHGCGADAYLAATPVYCKPAPEGQVQWFQKVLDSVDAPVMLYNIPSRTGMMMSPQVMRALKQHRNFWAVKESSGNMEMFIDYATAAPNLALYSGDDMMFAPAWALGAVGLVSVASNMWPVECKAYVDACREGTYHGQEWWKISKALFCTTNPIPLKAIMHKRGVINSPTLRLPLSIKDLASMEPLEKADALVHEWYDHYSKCKAAA